MDAYRQGAESFSNEQGSLFTPGGVEMDPMTLMAESRNKAQDPMVLNSGANAENVLEFLDDL